MDHFIWKVSIDIDTKFANLFEIEQYFKTNLISCNVHAQFRQLGEDIRAIERDAYGNVISTVYDLTNNTLSKINRVPNADVVLSMYNTFYNNNKDNIVKLAQCGVHLDSPVVIKNVQTDQDIVNQTLETIPKFIGTSDSLLRNMLPLHTEYTDYGLIYIKQDYIEIWFDDGHVDFIRSLDDDLYDNLYYKMYKEEVDTVRFAFPRSYDYKPNPQYISLGCPAGECGRSCLTDILNGIVDTEYLIQYINQTAEIINSWKSITKLFPDDPIRLENRIIDSLGYYFIFLGTNRDQTLQQFIDLQIEYLSQLLDYMDTIDKNAVLEYAKTALL